MPLLAIALSGVVGLALGLLGGGGSILTLPILLYAVGMQPRPAIATSLVVVAGASLVAMIAHARAGRVAWKLAAAFGAASMTTAFAAAGLAQAVAGRWLLGSFTAMMLLTGLAMLRRSSTREEVVPSYGKALGAGAGVGGLTGLVGAGGGFVIVPALTMFAGLDMTRAVGTSQLIISLNSLAGFAGYMRQVELDWLLTAMITAAAALGSLLGSLLSGQVHPTQMRRGFAILVIAMSLWMTVQQMPALLLRSITHDTRVTHLMAALLGGVMTHLAIHYRLRGAHTIEAKPRTRE